MVPVTLCTVWGDGGAGDRSRSNVRLAQYDLNAKASLIKPQHQQMAAMRLMSGRLAISQASWLGRDRIGMNILRTYAVAMAESARWLGCGLRRKHLNFVKLGADLRSPIRWYLMSTGKATSARSSVITTRGINGWWNDTSRNTQDYSHQDRAWPPKDEVMSTPDLDAIETFYKWSNDNRTYSGKAVWLKWKIALAAMQRTWPATPKLAERTTSLVASPSSRQKNAVMVITSPL